MSKCDNLFTGDLPGEIWKDVPGFEGSYEVSNLARVKSLPKPDSPHTNLLRFYTDKLGYKRTSLVKPDGSGNRTFLLHRLVAMAFLPNPENKRTVNHKNGIKLDNRAVNLEWHTWSENIKHAFDMGLKDQRGDRHHQRKVSSKEVLEIREKFNPFVVTRKDLAKQYGLSEASIKAIISRRNWSHI